MMTAETKLRDLNIPYFEVLLDEVFMVTDMRQTWPAACESASDLSRLTGRPLAEVLKSLQYYCDLSHDIFISALSTEIAPSVVIDMRSDRTQKRNWLQPPLYDLDAYVESLKPYKTVVVASEDIKRAYSATLQLRTLGCQQARCWQSGLQDL